MKKIKETIKAFLAIPFVKYGVVLVIGVVLIGFLVIQPQRVDGAVAHLSGLVFPENQLDAVVGGIRVVGVGFHGGD